MTYLGTQPVRQKVRQFVSPKWRQSAKGQNCTLQLQGCGGNDGTVVLCHLRFFAWAGVAQKPHDFLACYGCASCHRLLDENPGSWEFEDVFRAMGRTLTVHYEEGRIA